MKKVEKEKIIKSIENAKYMLVVTDNIMAAKGKLVEIMVMIATAIENLAEGSPLTEEEILKEIKDVLKIKKEDDKKTGENSSKINKMQEFLKELMKYE